MIARHVLRPKLASLSLLWLVACQVYDPGLLDARRQHAAKRAPRGEQVHDAGDLDAAADASDVVADAGTVTEITVGGCGNGVVDEGEACDTAIARGAAGACPDGCSGAQGCVRNELVGSACEARCAMHEVTDAVNGDGCCPSGLEYYQDDDCAPRCGNGQLEPGERCDPASECPTREACKANDACETARYLGAADSCNARCEKSRIQSCKNGDGCCAPGCDHASDDDCPEPMPPPFVCEDAHKGTDCKACDCAHCSAQLGACLQGEPQDAMLCGQAIDCAERARCTADACYCGNVSGETCAETPRGVCKMEWNAAARTSNARIVLLERSTTAFTIGKVTAVVSCRAQFCKAECGL